LARDRNLASAFVRADVDEYLYKLLPRRDATLRGMEAYARRHDVPIIGPAVARLLALLAKVSRARRIFEMGSAIGYSTIWLARAAGPQGEVFYTDGDPENARRARKSFRKAGIAGRIRVSVGDALELLRKSRGTFDLIFIDVDKHQYPAALKLAVEKLNRGGLLITDNTLWSGKVTRQTRDAETRGVQRYNAAAFSHPRLDTVLIPLRDGVTISRKR
jgi:caffeoyl-CoA O-methyltransferase